MLWWAYSGLSGSIALSLASAAMLLGMPAAGVARITIELLVALLVAGLMVQGCASYFGRHKGAKAPTKLPFTRLLSQSANRAATKPQAPEPGPAPAPRDEFAPSPRLSFISMMRARARARTLEPRGFMENLR